MADNYVGEGKSELWTNGTGENVVSGQVVVIGETLGVALVDIANGASGTVQTEGVFTVPKVTAAVIGQGESLVWDSSVGKFDDNAATPASGDISGNSVSAKEAGTSSMTTLKVKFFGTPGTKTA
jgi:predicted RecA/RadA family phage recombinase